MNKHSNLSASGSSTWLNCPGSVEAQKGIPNETSVYAEEGTLAHELADTVLSKHIDLQPDRAINYIGKVISCKSNNKTLSTTVDKEMAENVDKYIDYVLSYNKEGCVLYSEERVDYSKYVPGGFGTCDGAVIDVKNRQLHIFDLKYGKGVAVYSEENTQGMLYALGFYTGIKLMFDIEKITIHIIQPRIDNVSNWEITVDKLMKFGAYARERAFCTMQSNPDRIPGEKQCKWCRANKTCKALYNHTVDVMKAVFNEESCNNKTMSKKDIIKILDNSKLISKFISSVEEHALNMILNDGETIDGYKVVNGRANTKWNCEAEVKLPILLGENAYNKKLIGITDGRKLLEPDVFNNLTIKPEGKPTLVKSIDKREDISIDLKKMFDN